MGQLVSWLVPLSEHMGDMEGMYRSLDRHYILEGVIIRGRTGILNPSNYIGVFIQPNIVIIEGEDSLANSFTCSSQFSLRHIA